MSLFLSVVFTFEQGISELSVNDFRHNRTQYAAVKPIVSYKQSSSRKTILLLHKNVKLVIVYALLYGVTSLMLDLRKR